MTYIVVDYEATCSDKNEFPKDEMEIIEIGAVALDENFEQLSTFQMFVQPSRNSTLTEFCKKLTTIKQDDVDSGVHFDYANNQFKKWIDEFESPLFCSWGYYDKKQLTKDCYYHQVTYPFNDTHINIKEDFAKYKGLKRGVGLGKALKIMNMEFEGTPHRGLDDAKNIARLMKFL